MVEQVQATASVRPAQHFNQLSHQAHEVRPLHQPDPRIRNVFGPIALTLQGQINLSFQQGLSNVPIPYVKFPRNPGDL